MEKQTIERGKLRKAVGRQSEESRKAVGRQGRMSNVGRSQGRKESMTGITVNDLGVMGGGDVVMDKEGEGRGGVKKRGRESEGM